MGTSTGMPPSSRQGSKDSSAAAAAALAAPRTALPWQLRAVEPFLCLAAVPLVLLVLLPQARLMCKCAEDTDLKDTEDVMNLQGL
jgi:hypothetical protein